MSKGISLGTSGLDITELVTQSMKTYQTRYDNLYKKKVTQQWTKDKYVGLYSKITEFKNTDLSNFKLQSTLSKRAINNPKPEAVDVIARADSPLVQHNIDIQTLATNASVRTMNGQKASVMVPVDPADPTGPQKSSSKLSDVGVVTFPAGFDPDDPAQADQVALKLVISDGTTDDAGRLKKKTISFTYGELYDGKIGVGTPDETYHTGATLNDLASKINKAGTNLQANYDSTNDSFSVYNTKTGPSNKVIIDGDTNSPTYISYTALISNLHLGQYMGNNQPPVSLAPGELTDGTVAGTKGKVTIDGIEYEPEENEVRVDGVTYKMIGTTGGVVTIGLSNDTKAIAESIQKFVDKYNALLEAINKELFTDRDKVYTPLTDEEKKGMSDREIEKWEEKAQAGLLRNDSILSGIVTNMRNALSSRIGDQSYNTASALGIETKSFTEHGILHLTVEDLEEALSKDPEAAYNIFGGAGGIGAKIDAVLNTGIKQLVSKAGDSATYEDQSFIGKNIIDLNEELAQMLKDNQKREQAFYEKYNKMEAAMAQIESAASSITSLLG